MVTPAPTNGAPDASKEDFVSKHGKRVVVIIFSILIGDTIPVIVQHGLSPNELFYTIVGVILPYTGALVLVFLYMAESSNEHPYGLAMVAGFIFMMFFALAVGLHWGITDWEADQVNQQMRQANHVAPGAPQKAPPMAMAAIIGVLIQFYFHKYGAPLFIAATLAAVVITWNIVKWTEKGGTKKSTGDHAGHAQ